jgi:hypothetical protein
VPRRARWRRRWRAPDPEPLGVQHLEDLLPLRRLQRARLRPPGRTGWAWRRRRATVAPVPARARPAGRRAGRGGPHDRGQRGDGVLHGGAHRPVVGFGAGRRARWAYVAAGREPAKQRGEFPWTSITLAWRASWSRRRALSRRSRALSRRSRVDRRAATASALAERGQCALVTLLAPLRDQRGVQALAAQQRALAGLVELLVLGKDAQLVGGRVLAWRPGRSGTSGRGRTPFVQSVPTPARRSSSPSVWWSSLALHSPIQLGKRLTRG